ncbi:unnamed protein product [Schistosoma rodhaini]|nr:unnamed protein product [Schistosoma rodhaini]
MMMNTTISDEVYQQQMIKNNSLDDINNIVHSNQTHSPNKSLSLTYSSTIKSPLFNHEDSFPSRIQTKSSNLICTTYPISLSSYHYTISPSISSNHHQQHQQQQHQHHHINTKQNVYSQPYEQDHQKMTTPSSSSSSSSSSLLLNNNYKHTMDSLQSNHYDMPYTTNQQSNKIWQQSNEILNDTFNTTTTNTTDNNDQLNRLQAWLKYPLHEYDHIKWNSQLLENTMKIQTKGSFSENSKSILTIPTTTSTVGTKNGIIFNPIESSFTSSITPSPIERTNMKPVSNNNIDNDTEHFNDCELKQYENNHHRQNTILNQPQNLYKFTKSSFDYLNDKSSKQNSDNKTESYKRTIKYHGHIKKPLNAFMLFMKEMRSQVIAECTLKESAAINQILGRKWHALSSEAQAKYYKLAKQEKELHQRLYPGWSARDNYATQVKRRSRTTTKINRTTITTTTTVTTPTPTVVTDPTIIGNNNNNNNNNNNHSNYEKTYHSRKLPSSFTDSELWCSTNHSNNLFHTTNNDPYSKFIQPFTDCNLLQSFNTNYEYEYIKSNELCHSTNPFNKMDTTTTHIKLSRISNYEQLYNSSIHQSTTLPYSQFNNDNHLSYGNLLTTNTMNSSIELNPIQSSNEDQYSMNKSMKVDYAVHSLMDLNYESVIHSNDNSKDQDYSLKYTNKYDKIPISSTNSTIDQFNIRKDLPYPTNKGDYPEENTSTLLHHLWSDNESINQYPCCSTYYLGFCSTNDCFSSKFTDSLQYDNTKSDLIEYDQSSNVVIQHNTYLTTNPSYLQCNNPYKVPEIIHEHDPISSVTSNQMNDPNITSNESLLTMMNMNRSTSKSITEQYFEDQPL